MNVGKLAVGSARKRWVEFDILVCCLVAHCILLVYVTLQDHLPKSCEGEHSVCFICAIG